MKLQLAAMFCISNLIWNEEEGKRLVRSVLWKIMGGKVADAPEILGAGITQWVLNIQLSHLGIRIHIGTSQSWLNS